MTRKEILLVDHTDGGDELATDKYVAWIKILLPGGNIFANTIARHDILLPGRKYCFQAGNNFARQKISLPGMKYCCQAENIVARKETLLVITRTVETDWHLVNMLPG